MKRPLKAEEIRLWSLVVSTVRPAPGRGPTTAPDRPPPVTAGPIHQDPGAPAKLKRRALGPAPSTPLARLAPPAPKSPGAIEPLRKRRLAKERDPIEARLDLHGLDQDRARSALHDFLLRAHHQGWRAVLVITGKGALGDGVLRRRTPEWLSEPPVRAFIAGFSPAERRHGGEGALYVALKRRQA